MAIIEISVTPLGVGTMGVSEFVTGCLKLARESGLNYQLTPMGTIIEGDMATLFPLLQQMHESPFLAGAERVSTLIKIDDRRDCTQSMQSKVDSVLAKLK